MNYRQIKAIEADKKRFLLDLYPDLDEQSGIYFLIRIDENGIRYAYVGQAKKILTRLAQHLTGYQHIDLSLRKHGLYSSTNPNGWKISYLHFSVRELNEKERFYIKKYADKGYQLRNKDTGGGAGKIQIDEFRPSRGYRDGLAQGRKNLARELNNIIGKHLIISLKPEKANNKVSIRALEKFNALLNVEESEV